MWIRIIFCFLEQETFDQLTCKDLVEVERVQILTSILGDILPKCSLAFNKLNSSCKSKSCGLKIRISFNNDIERLVNFYRGQAPIKIKYMSPVS